MPTTVDGVNGVLTTNDFATPTEAAARVADSLVVSPKGVGAAFEAAFYQFFQDWQFYNSATLSYRAKAPGRVPAHYASTIEGAPSVLSDVDTSTLFSTEEGPCVRLTGGALITHRDPIELFAGAKARVQVRVRRASAPSPIDAAPVEIGIAWLDGDLLQASLVTPEKIVVDTDLSTGAWATYSFTIGQVAASDVDHYSAEAKAARVFVRHAGVTGATDVRILYVSDVSYTALGTEAAANAEARLTALEAAPVSAAFEAEALSTSANVDTLVTPGLYDIVSPTTADTGATDRAARMVVAVERSDADTGAQVWRDAIGNNGNLYVRLRTLGAWTALRKIVYEDEMDAQIQAVLNAVGGIAEGTWTPTLLSSVPGSTPWAVTYSTSPATVAHYRRSGDWVDFYGRFHFTVTAKNDALGGVYIGGLPYEADVVANVSECPVSFIPHENWIAPATGGDHYLGPAASIFADANDANNPLRRNALKLGWLRHHAGSSTERAFYDVADIVEGSEYKCSFSGRYKVITV